jgi:guanylate kinase
MIMNKKLLGNLKRGLLFIVSAPAGTGKTTLVDMLTKEFPQVVASVSYTTRKPRSGEVNGIHYHFISKEEFLSRVEKGEFLEFVELYGEFYGTSQAWLEEQLVKGRHVVLVIDTQGAIFLRGKVAATSIFLSPPSYEELAKRLTGRQTDSTAAIEKRLLWAKEEMSRKNVYDYVVINDDLPTAYQVLRSILIAEEHRVR